MELEGKGVKGVVTPGLKVLAHQVDKEEPLPTSEVTRFRALAARANFLAADRPDISFAVKELARAMSAPSAGS